MRESHDRSALPKEEVVHSERVRWLQASLLSLVQDGPGKRLAHAEQAPSIGICSRPTRHRRVVDTGWERTVSAQTPLRSCCTRSDYPYCSGYR